MTRPRNSNVAAVDTAIEPSTSNASPLDEMLRVELRPGLEGRYGMCPTRTLLANPNAVRTHSNKHIRKVARSMEINGTLAPLVIDEKYMVLAGHGRLQGAKLNGDANVPVLQVFGLSEAQKRHYLLADNEISRDAGLDRGKLAQQLGELTVLFEEAGIEIAEAGVEIAELDEIVEDATDGTGEEETLGQELFEDPITLRSGDTMLLGSHRLIVGDARDGVSLDALLAGERADAAFLDPPYNVVSSSIGGRGQHSHPNFAFASGEMSESEFVAFLTTSLQEVAKRCRPGAVVFVCIDWKHVAELIAAGRAVFSAFLNIVVWNKTNAGQGGLYRNKHELICVFKVGDAPHQDNVQKGRFGRNRSNVWTYAGVNTFRAGRMEDLADHPTVKPTQMIADAMKDVTRNNAVVLDTFVGSGTTILAGEKVGRRVRAVEIEPRYAQVAVRRWEKMTGRDAIHLASGMTFEQLAHHRLRAPATSVARIDAPMPRVRVRSRPPQ